MKWTHAVGQRILHLLKSKERHGIHSPLIYQLMETDLKIPLPDHVRIIEEYRKKLLHDHSIWNPNDLGAGSRLNSSKTLSTAVKRASSNKKKVLFYSDGSIDFNRTK